jgi:hypothetical protein
MMTALLSPEITTGPQTERCDRCGAAAKMQIVLTGGGMLAFCGHHANKHAGGIARIAAKVTVDHGFEWPGHVPTA